MQTEKWIPRTEQLHFLGFTNEVIRMDAAPFIIAACTTTDLFQIITKPTIPIDLIVDPPNKGLVVLGQGHSITFKSRFDFLARRVKSDQEYIELLTKLSPDRWFRGEIFK
jgi:hypothetical protein